MTHLYQGKNKIKFAVAPMLDWTDRHCRFFHRQLTHQALLYSEMVVADAIIHGDRSRLLHISPSEHPVALQLGGFDADKLAQAARIGADFGYDEINLNVGCPSNRVQSGTFGACLMREPETVARAVVAMKQAVNIPVTVKCRIGVDEQDTQKALDDLGEKLVAAGVDAIWIHARKAWLQGLSPKENRDIPPLDYERVYRFKRHFSPLFVGINGGITTKHQVQQHLKHVDAVMIGRAAYQRPQILTELDEASSPLNYETLIETMCAYAQTHIAAGGRLSAITRHMIGLFHGVKGARAWRQILSSKANHAEADSSILRHAFLSITTQEKASG